MTMLKTVECISQGNNKCIFSLEATLELELSVREAFKNKNDETYGKSFVIFYCLKMISDSF